MTHTDSGVLHSSLFCVLLLTPLSQLFSSGKTGRALLESFAGKTFGLHLVFIVQLDYCRVRFYFLLVLIVELDSAFYSLGPSN